MQTRWIAGVAAVALVVTLGAGVGFGEDEPAEPKPMTEQEMWAKVMQLSQPTEMHTQVLTKLVGTWDATGKAITSMGEVPFSGKAVNTSVLGGRFVKVEYEGPFMGSAFEGLALVGFDNLGKTFQQTWIMTMSTNMDFMTGTWDAETNTLTWRGSTEMPDGNTYAKRTTARFEGDKIFEESFATGPDGQERKEMEMTYTRAP